MPRKPSSPQLYRAQQAQVDVMDDICTILRVTNITGTYSDDETSIATGTLSAVCGFYFTNGQIKQNGQILFVNYDVVMRLPTWTPVYLNDQVVLIEKGTVVVSGTFTPTEFPEVGSTAQTVHLRRVS